MGRKAIDPNEKKQLVRVFVKQKVINAFTETELQQQVNEFINQLQSEALQKCADESLKNK
jgi:hypothetical protein